MQLYALSDMLLICEPDPKAESGFRYLKHVVLNERSYCQSISLLRLFNYRLDLLGVPNRRYAFNLTKVIGRNLSVTFVSETPEYKEQLLGKLRKLLGNLRSKSMTTEDNYEIEVQVIGS